MTEVVEIVAEMQRQLRQKVAKFPGGCVADVRYVDGPSPLLHLCLFQKHQLNIAVGCRFAIETIDRTGIETIADIVAKNLQMELFRKITGL